MNTLEYLAQNLGRDLFTQVKDVYSLLAHPGKVYSIQPWSLLFRPEEILLNYPYEIYNSNCQLLYRVSNHQGVFGLSNLDVALMIEAQTGDTYFLKYSTYKGIVTIALVVDKTPQDIKIQSRIPEPPASSQNIMVMNLLDGYQDFSKPGAPLFPTELYFVGSSPSKLPTFYGPVATYNQTVISYTPNTQSGWLALKQNNQPLYLEVASGSGNDRLIHKGNGLYYLVVGNDINLDLIRQALGLPNLFSTQDYINLNINVSKDP